MSDPDPDAVAAISSESDLENAPEEVQNAFRSSEVQIVESYTETSAVLSDEDDA